MSNVLNHEHKWTNWKNNKPMNIASQPELIILSARRCTLPECAAVQSRIGKVKVEDKLRGES